VNAALVGILAGESDFDTVAVGFGVKPLNRFKRNALKRLLSLSCFVEYFLERFPLPTLLLGLGRGCRFFDLWCHSLLRYKP
jgi:hypothetical protein